MDIDPLKIETEMTTGPDSTTRFHLTLSAAQWVAVVSFLIGGGIMWGSLKSDFDALRISVNSILASQSSFTAEIRSLKEDVIRLQDGQDRQEQRRGR